MTNKSIPLEDCRDPTLDGGDEFVESLVVATVLDHMAAMPDCGAVAAECLADS
jgi:hypothetical protein